MSVRTGRLRSVLALLVVLSAGLIARAGEEPADWQAAAGRYLDDREKVWFEHAKCVSCHTVLPYALARPSLRGVLGVESPTEQESKLLAQIKARVANWKKLDTEEFGLYYDDSDQKKRQSWGTEAVFNAVILAFDDRYQGRTAPCADTRQAFANLWETQTRAGDERGSWDWLDFNEAPWGNTEARYFGAALAAIAVGTAPGYYAPGADAQTNLSVALLRGYLKDAFPKQNLHNRAWALWAATKVDGILTQAARRTLLDQLLVAQGDDGGWSMPSLGTWTRNDRTAQETASDGYATAFVLHVLQTAGLPRDDVKIAKGLEWLRHNQAATGAWRSVSVVKKRDHASHTGKFMSDAATAFAVLALSPPATPAKAPATDAVDGPVAASVKGMRLKVSPNGRYFVDQDGKPFFYLGDTCWLLFQRLNHDEVDEYLKDRAAKGFTVIQAYVIRGLDKRHPDGNSSLLGEPPFIDRDATKPNEAYFKNMDYVVNRANELGLVMGLVTSKSWHVNKTPEQVFDEQNAYTFGKFLGARYKNNAVIWYPGGDSVPGKDDAVWVAMAKGVRDGCDGTQLISYHGSGQTSSSTWYHKADWLNFNTIQSGHTFASDSYPFVTKDYAQAPAKPTVDMEPAYENHPTGAGKPRVDAHKVRTQAYTAMLAGAAGHAYGSLDLFWFYKDRDGPFPKNGFQHWRTALAYPGTAQMGALRRLFERYPWYKLAPDQSVLASEVGAGPWRLVAARAEDGSFAICYAPRGQSFQVRMDRLTREKVKARWYDPRDGSWREIGEFTNSGAHEFKPPSSGESDDWVLVLDASG